VFNCFYLCAFVVYFWIRDWSYIGVSLLILFFLLFWRHSSKKPEASSFQIGSGWNLFSVVLREIQNDYRSRISDMTSYFQDGGHDVRPPLATAHAAASACCPLACIRRLSEYTDDTYMYIVSGKKKPQFFLHNFNKCRHKFRNFWHEPSWGLILLRK